MNILQKIVGVLFPPYKFSVTRKEQGKLFNAIISSLTDDFLNIKEQLVSAKLMDLKDWALFPAYKFTTIAYAGESVFGFQKRGENYKISGVKIFSKTTRQWENIEILIQDNLIQGLLITNSKYELKEFDLTKINTSNISKNEFFFPRGEIDLFYDKLPQNIKAILNQNSMSEIDFANRTYYSFYDLEDGNYLAVDKQQNVYSLVHDARPLVKKMKVTFKSVLDELANGTFNKERHLDERYRGNS